MLRGNIIVLFLALALAPAEALAQTGPSDGPFSATIRGAELAEALEQLVELTGIDLVYTSELVAGRHTYCAQREVSAEELLRCVLAETGVDYVRSSSGAYVLILARKTRPPAAHLAGVVVDAESGEPMPMAHVLLADAATVADANGYFSLANLPPGAHQVMATFVGYEPSPVIQLWMAPGQSEHLTIELVPAMSALAPVVVDGLLQRLPSASLGSAEVEADEAAPSSFSGTPDVIRGATATMGVSTALPLADLHIQGGNAAEHVTRLDGVPVRDPVALGRYLGAFSPLAVGRVHVHKAGFGPEHGSLLSGAIDVRHRLESGPPTASAQADPLSANARLSIPLNIPGTSGGAAMVALRQSAWGLYQDPGVSDLLARASRIDPLIGSLWLDQPVNGENLRLISREPRVRFSDVHAALRVRPDAYSTVSASLFRAGNFVAADQAAALAEGDAQRGLVFSDLYDWSNWAGQASYSRIIGARTVLSIRARASHHASLYAYDYAAEVYDTDGQPGRDRPFVGRGARAAHELTELGLGAEASVSLAPGAHLAAGLDADVIDAHFAGGNAWITPFNAAEREVQVSSYAQARMSIGRQLVVEGGSRFTLLPSSGQVYAEPRAAVRYDGALAGTDGYALRLAGGLYRQFVNGFPFRSAGPASLVPELWFWLPATADVVPPRAGHLALDGLLLLAGGLTLRAEAYARTEPLLLALDTRSLMQHDDGGRQEQSAVVGSVSGSSLGAGVGAQWQHRRATVSASYTFERTRRTTLLLEDDLALPVPWEEPHRVSASSRVDLGQGFGVAAAARGVWGRTWGLRHAYYEYLNGAVTSDVALDQPATNTLPAYVAADASASYTVGLAGGQWRFELGLANALDRQNVVDYSVDAATGALLPRLLPGRRVTFALRVDL